MLLIVTKWSDELKISYKYTNLNEKLFDQIKTIDTFDQIFNKRFIRV